MEMILESARQLKKELQQKIKHFNIDNKYVVKVKKEHDYCYLVITRKNNIFSGVLLKRAIQFCDKNNLSLYVKDNVVNIS